LEIVGGVFLLLGLHILAFVILGTLGYIFSAIIPGAILFNQIFLFSLLGIGISQLVYVIPIAIQLNRRQQWGTMKGLIIGAVLTALLNGGCFLIIFSASR
jgi:hypothetical protein